MTRARLVALTALAMLAFAGNSLLCRVALRQTDIDPASLTRRASLPCGWHRAP